MISYYIHTYQHASGHKQVTRRSVYQPWERETALENLELMGGHVEAVKTSVTYSKRGKRTIR